MIIEIREGRPVEAMSKVQRIAYFLIVSSVAAHFSLGYLRTTTQMVQLVPYLHFDVDTPFRYRILPAYVYVAFEWAVDKIGFTFPNLNPPLDLQENWFMVLLAFGCLIASTYTAAATIRSLVSSSWMSWLSLLLPLCCYFDYVLVLNRNLFYPYDLPALFLFTVLVHLAVTDRPVWFAVAFAPAVLTKETAVFALLLYFLLVARRRPVRWTIAYFGAMGALFVAVKYLLFALLYRPCSACSGVVDFQLVGNLKQLLNPLFWLSIVSVFAFLWIFVVVLWRWIDLRLKYAFIGVIASWVTAMLIVGVIREVRIFSELSILVILLVVVGMDRWLPQTTLLRADGAEGTRAGGGDLSSRPARNESS